MGAIWSLVLEGKVTSFLCYKFPWTILGIRLSFWSELKNFYRNFAVGLPDYCTTPPYLLKNMPFYSWVKGTCVSNTYSTFIPKMKIRNSSFRISYLWSSARLLGCTNWGWMRGGLDLASKIKSQRHLGAFPPGNNTETPRSFNFDPSQHSTLITSLITKLDGFSLQKSLLSDEISSQKTKPIGFKICFPFSDERHLAS